MTVTAAAACTNAATSRWGRSGVLATWGTNSVATKNGWSASSTMRTSPVASVPLTRRRRRYTGLRAAPPAPSSSDVGP
jgi:hypothetical protein